MNFTHQFRFRMLCKPHRGKTICTTGQQGDYYVDKRDPVGKVGPGKQSRGTPVIRSNYPTHTVSTGVKLHTPGRDGLIHFFSVVI